MEKVKVKIWLRPEIHKAILARKDREGKTLSAIIEEAVEQSLVHAELMNQVQRAGQMMREVRDELMGIRAEIASTHEVMRGLLRTLEELKGWLRVSAFWGALSVELQKIKYFNTIKLSDEEFRKYLSSWENAHSYADARIESLTGQRVWKRSFDPTVVPSKK